MFEFSLEDAKTVFEQSTDGIVLFDRQGQAVYTNRTFNLWPDEVQQALLDNRRGCHLYQVRQLSLSNGSALIAHYQAADSYDSNSILTSLLADIRNGEDIYQATASAIHRATGWRWVSITRFQDQNVEVLAHWDTDGLSDTFSFEIAGTPCEMMARSERYTLFSDVSKAFPENAALQQMGASTYAGLIYRGGNQQPVGHIMAMHDQRDVDYRHVEDVITLASLALSSNMQLAHANDQLESALQASLTDPLTGLANRKQFDEMREEQASNYENHQRDACMAIVDLNSFKQYNDNYGHRAGDMLLKLVATELAKLGRESDIAFRIGGDEFALIYPGVTESAMPRLCQQFKAAMHRISLVCGHPVDSSAGCALLSESNGCQESWYELADQRMYDQKPKARCVAI